MYMQMVQVSARVSWSVPRRVWLPTQKLKKIYIYVLYILANFTAFMIFCALTIYLAFTVAVRSKAWVCDRSPAEIVGSNPSGGIYIFLF